MEDLKKMLDKEIVSQFEILETSTDNRSEAISHLLDLYKLKNEERDRDFNEFVKSAELNQKLELDLKRLEEDIKDKQKRVYIDAANIVLPLIFYGYWMKKGLKFEETGSFTSTTFRNLISKFKIGN